MMDRRRTLFNFSDAFLNNSLESMEACFRNWMITGFSRNLDDFFLSVLGVYLTIMTQNC